MVGLIIPLLLAAAIMEAKVTLPVAIRLLTK
jgi:hypothetical protein